MPLTNDRNPLVSIVITSYNRGNLIKNALESALSQNYENLEIIISDNNSTDNTEEILEPYLSNHKIKFYRNEKNIGMIPNFKLATEKRATGDYITYISSDDHLINDSFIKQAVQLVNSYENILIVFGKNQTYIETEKKIVDDRTHRLYTKEFMPGTEVFLRFANSKALGWGGAFINRKELIKLNIFESRSTSLDYEANLLLMLKGNIGFIKTPTYIYRVHSNQASHLNSATDVINNYSYVLEPYSYALSNKVLPKKVLDDWKNDLISLESQYNLLKFLPYKKREYRHLKKYYKLNHPVVLKRLRKSVKWNILATLYSIPKFSIILFKLLSKGHYNNLKHSS